MPPGPITATTRLNSDTGAQEMMVLGYMGIALTVLGATLVGISIFGDDVSLWLSASGVAALLIGASLVDGFREKIIQRLKGSAHRDGL